LFRFVFKRKVSQIELVHALTLCIKINTISKVSNIFLFKCALSKILFTIMADMIIVLEFILTPIGVDVALHISEYFRLPISSYKYTFSHD